MTYKTCPEKASFLRVGSEIHIHVLINILSKTHMRLKERFLTGRNRTKRANFRRSPLFQATYNIKTEKNKQLIQLILCQLDARRLAEGKGHETDSTGGAFSWTPFKGGFQI